MTTTATIQTTKRRNPPARTHSARSGPNAAEQRLLACYDLFLLLLEAKPLLAKTLSYELATVCERFTTEHAATIEAARRRARG